MTKTINVRRLPRDTGPAGWNSILPPARTHPELKEDIRADWVVVGGGFAGMAAARRLSQLVGDDRVVLLEAGRLAQGPAGRNSGFMIDLPHELNSETYAGAAEADMLQIRLNRAAIDFARNMAREFDMPERVFDPCGKLTGAATAKGAQHIDSYARHLEGLGEQYRLLDAGEMKAHTGIDFYQKGLYTPGAVMIQPAAFIRMAAEGLAERVAIYEQSPVLKMDLGDEHVLHTPQGRVRARHVILAVNGHIQSFGFYPRQLLHVFTYASMTRALSAGEAARLGGTPDWGVLPADPMGTTVRRVSSLMGSGDRVTVRNRFTLNQSMEISERQLRDVFKAHDRAFAARFPMLDGVPMEHRWGGRLCLSWNSVPAFGELESRVYSAACQNGLGTVKGTLSGMLAVDLALNHRSELLDEFMSYEAPRRLPPEPFLSVGANLTMRWKEWLAGIEL
ncbi:FAD-binding oxidoreductase [Oceanimonas pelagia]|uniref:FAD-binding oxidoreductase n=1 Tax=Oceanimonas pelagia TaxID=3028314 RepID=A0AA50KNX0_9GAMM|nr:FAD-binding oxidoreductase [Oceanimonas pelagia]WMC11671.1 FAD-binding oxidoreductase [Oceanimonas pelagia]